MFFMEEKKTYAPILPYDATIGQYFSTYETIPYCCDRDLCHPNIVISTGNIVKCHTYNLEEEPTKINSELFI